MPMSGAAFSRRLNWIYLAFGLAFLAFVGVMALLEQMGLPRRWIGFLFLVGPIVFYAGIGILARTTDRPSTTWPGAVCRPCLTAWLPGPTGRAPPPSSVTAGTLVSSAAMGGLAYVLGWTGGFCLVALLLAPYLRQFGQFTIPDFIGARYGNDTLRLLSALAAMGVSLSGGADSAAKSPHHDAVTV